MSKGTILVVGSNATQLEAQGGGTITIGQFLNETVVPLMTLATAGYDFVLPPRPARSRIWTRIPMRASIGLSASSFRAVTGRSST